MEYRHQDDAGRSEQFVRSRGNKLVLALVLGAVALILVGRNYRDWLGEQQVKRSDSNYEAFIAAVHKADDIADPLQRCLKYPDLPGTHWDEATTTAYCQLRNRHTLQLSQIDTLLQQNKADEVDRTFQAYMDTELHDPKQPGVLEAAFFSAGFGDAKPETRKIIDEWKRQSPNSAFALVASGMQYVAAAQQARGDSLWKDVRDDQAEGMHQQLVLARQDLDRAVKLVPTVTPAYTEMVYAGALESDQDYSYRAANQGLAVDPSNFALRAQMMDLAQPKWSSEFGGEDEQMQEDEALIARNPLLRMVAQDAYVNRANCECANGLESQAQLIALAADKNMSYSDLSDLGSTAYDNHDLHLAVELYSESLRFNQDNPDVLQWRAHQMAMLGDPSGAIEGVLQAAHRFPDDSAIGTKLGNIYAFTGHVKEAESAFLAVLQRDPDYPRAMAELGDLYNHAGHQPDKAKALSDTLISRHPDDPDGYIVRACNQMDHNLPGVYDTIHYFIDHFGDNSDFKSQTAEMRAYLAKHPEPKSS